MTLDMKSTGSRAVYDFCAAAHLENWPGHTAGLHFSAHTEDGTVINLWFDYPQIKRMREAIVEAEKRLDREIHEWAERLAGQIGQIAD